MLSKITINSVVEEGFTFAVTAERGDDNHVWTIRVWEIPFGAAITPRWRDAVKTANSNTHEHDLDMSHAPKHTGLVWQEIADMLDSALHDAQSREAMIAGPYSDAQSRL